MIKCNTMYLKSIYISIGKHHRRVVFIEWVSSDGTDETGICTVSVGQRMCKIIQMSTTYRTITVALNHILLVAVSADFVKEIMILCGIWLKDILTGNWLYFCQLSCPCLKKT